MASHLASHGSIPGISEVQPFAITGALAKNGVAPRFASTQGFGIFVGGFLFLLVFYMLSICYLKVVESLMVVVVDGGGALVAGCK